MFGILIMIVGVSTGFLSGLLGVGGGTLLVPALVVIASLTQHQAQGISLAVMIPIAALGAWGYYRPGHLRLERYWPLAGGAVVGALAGAFLANGLPASDLRRLFGGFIVFLAVKLLWGELGNVSKST